ncbi:MAG: PRC-barrel domain-containing protein [Nitrococcus mobilis]|nr:PRC-barrel domain-containing protein [Nitrococcus mobilis]
MAQHTSFNKALLAAFMAAGFVIGSNAMAEPQGLYSADELSDANVFSKSNPDKKIGEVEDILLDDAMRVRALVVETGGLLDMGSKEYVINAGKFTLETRNADNLEKLEYIVHLDMTKEELEQQPEYTNDWWTQTKAAARQAWQNTKEGAASAWESTKAAASNALDNIGGALESPGDEVEQGTDQREDKMGTEQ